MTPLEPPLCTAEVALNRIAYAAQELPLWCWAATTEMIFSAYGYDVPQDDVVKLVYGDYYNVRSGPISNISALLSRTWTDRNGRRFHSELRGLYDYFLKVAAIDNSKIIGALRQDRPLFYCNRSHAMVQNAIYYSPTPLGPQVVSIGLVDPWPGVGPRGPKPGEMAPVHLGGALTYLAYPVITDLD